MGKEGEGWGGLSTERGEEAAGGGTRGEGAAGGGTAVFTSDLMFIYLNLFQRNKSSELCS